MKFSKQIILFLLTLFVGHATLCKKFSRKDRPFKPKIIHIFEQNIEEETAEEENIAEKNFGNDEQLPIAVIICSYNNAKWAVRNLESIFSQNYKNFRVIYVDDASTDGTPNIVQEYINKHGLQEKFTFIRNTFRGRKLKNMYKSYRTCHDNEIIVQLDGDDWFAHQNVLAFINNQYKRNDIWLTYGTHKNHPPETAALGTKSCPTLASTVRHRTFRRDFHYMPLRTFYAWLFKQIKLEDMIASHLYNIQEFRGKFYPAANDAVIMWAMLEMAYKKFKYIPQILYIANRGNPIIGIKVDRKLQEATAKDISKVIPLYPIIQNSTFTNALALKSLQATGIIFSADNPEALKKVLEATMTYIKNLNQLIVLYCADTTAKEYQIIQENYKNIRFINISDIRIYEYMRILESIASPYILLLNDNVALDQKLHCNQCIQELEKTAAYGFYCCLSDKIMAKKKIPYEHIMDNVYVWKFGCDTNKQIGLHNFDITLYRKKDMVAEFRKISNQQNVKKLLEEWALMPVPDKKVGLFFGTYTN